MPMRRIFGILSLGMVNLLFVFSQTSVLQNRLVKGQYWFDTVTPTNAVTVTDLTYEPDSIYATVSLTNVDVSILSQGRHLLYFRFQDQNGKWGEPQTSTFYVNNPPTMNRVVKGQYWFNSPTTPGNAVLVDTTTSDENDLIFFQNLSVDVSSLANGTHMLYFRTQDRSGKWGIPMATQFRKSASQVQKRIAKGEYWFNSVTRPASGVTDISTSVRSGDSTYADVQNLSISLPASLNNGKHTVYVRFQDINGVWGAHVAQQFVIDQSSAPPLMTQMEYFFGNTDPGQGTASAPKPGTFGLTNGGRGAVYTDTFQVAPLGLPLGQNKFSARFKSDKNEWGPVSSAFFSILTRPVLTSSVIDSLRFGTLISGRDSSTKTFVIRNSGDAALKVKTGTKPSTQWSVKFIDNGSEKDSIQLSANSFSTESTIVAVKYKPLKSGAVNSFIQFITNDSVKPMYNLPVSAFADSAKGKLAYSSDSIKFGQRTVSTTSFASITLLNSGLDTILITASTPSTPYFLVPLTKSKLAPNNSNDTVKLTVRFSPTFQGNYNGYSLVITVRNRFSQVLETKIIYFNGSAIINPNPTINPSTTLLNFGAISSRAQDNKDTTLTFTIGNVGTQNLSVKSISSSDTSVFKPSFTQTLPNTIEFTGSMQINVKFKPTVNQFKTFTGNLTILSNSFNADSVLVIPMTGDGTNGAPLGVFSLSDTTVDYGSVTIGFNTSRNITISNTGGNRMLNISSLSINEGSFTTTQTVPFQVAPDSSRTFSVKFAPLSAGTVLATMNIQSDANVRSFRSVELKGIGVTTPQPILESSVSSIIFGATKVQTPNTVYFKFKNAGNDSLRADSIYMAKKSTSAFSVNKNKLTLGPNGTDSLLITFTPLAIANYTDSLIFVSNLNPSRYGIFASGSGAVLAITIDTTVAPPNPIIVGGNQPQQIGVSLTASLGTNVVALLYYKIAGAVKFDSIQMTSSDGIKFQGTIPADKISDRGAVYYIRISNGIETVSLPQNFVSVTFPTGVTKSQDQPAGTKQTNYRMISVPLSGINGSADSILKNFGTYNKNKWRLFRYQGISSGYVEHTNPLFQGFAPGRGYWFITATPQKLRSGTGQVTSANQTFNIDLQYEWNQIGNPFNFPVSWDSVIKTTDVGTLRSYNGVDFPPVTVLQPWEGYFVKNSNQFQNTVTIGVRPIDPNTPSLFPKLSEQGAPHLNSGEWMVQLKSTDNTVEDNYNYFGVKHSASDGFDANDMEESPKQPGEFLKIQFNHSDWKEHPDRYSYDFRSPDEEGKYWDVELHTNSTQENITVSIDQFGSVPKNFEIVIIDADAAMAADLRKKNEFTVSTAKKEMTRGFRIIIGTKDFVERNNFGITTVPVEFALHQNYPNPFNPSTTINFALPKKSHVTLTVFDILGKEIRTLMNETKDEGYHTAQWNSLNSIGAKVSSGLYFCRINAKSADGSKSFVQTTKMLLVK